MHQNLHLIRTLAEYPAFEQWRSRERYEADCSCSNQTGLTACTPRASGGDCMITGGRWLPRLNAIIAVEVSDADPSCERSGSSLAFYPLLRV
jgi:hypothetical protein